MKQRINLWESFRAAIRGLKVAAATERNFKLMIGIALFAVFLSFYLPFSQLERIIIIAAAFGVLILELVNTAIERIMDFVCPVHDEKIKIIKDLSAAFVFLACIVAAIIGGLLFWPKLF